MTVRQLLSNANAHELAEWQAFFKIENERHDEVMGKRPKKVKSKLAAMKAMFGNRVKKRGDDGR